MDGVLFATATASERVPLMTDIMVAAQLLVTVSMLALVRQQVSIAVRHIEQSRAGELQLQQISEALQNRSTS